MTRRHATPVAAARRSTGRTRAVAWLPLLLATVVACDVESTDDAVPDQAAAGIDSPTLLEVMTDLGTDMQRLHEALWVDDYAGVAAAAQSVADHPEVSPAERQRIFGILGPEGVAFRDMDVRVHDTSVELAAASREGESGPVLNRLAALEAACVACHDTFRDRLRQSASSEAPRGIDSVSAPDRGEP